jgi:hypothetical protein
MLYIDPESLHLAYAEGEGERRRGKGGRKKVHIRKEGRKEGRKVRA